MAPQKSTRVLAPAGTAGTKLSISTRSRSTIHQNSKDVRSKRKADSSPSKEGAVKRSALGDLTNAISRNKNIEEKCKAFLKQTTQVTTLKKVTVQTKVLPSLKTVQRQKHNENLAPPPAPANKGNKILTRAAVRTVAPNQTAQKPKDNIKENTTARVKTRLSNEFEKTDESLYSTALEDITNSSIGSAKGHIRASSSSSEFSSPEKILPSNVTLVAQQLDAQLVLNVYEVPDGIEDFDKENWDDIFQVSHYAMEIFNYLKDREDLFDIPDYMDRQICLNPNMRTMLVDWMVEIQESFELNHETLYLGVKLVDTYLSKMTVGKETLQLVGAAAMFISCKYDERMTPAIDDFLYICDGAYSRRELIRMEINVLKVCNFDLGIPISYRFLRRYARCAKVAMPVLTLARFILELSLMDYSTVSLRDSKLAAAALYLALRMSKTSEWTSTLEFYSGYKLEEFIEIVYVLNNGLHKKPREQCMTVRNKYSHRIFFEVARTPLMKNEQLRP